MSKQTDEELRNKTQAIEIAEKNNNTVLFCIALADASQIS